jgi:RHS repeat-associated protein
MLSHCSGAAGTSPKPNSANAPPSWTSSDSPEVIDNARLGWDPDLDVVRMGVRDYDAKLSQFLTPDPLFLENLDKCAESPLECNLYGYAKGNPLSWTDPSGMDVVTYSECRDCGPISKAVGIEARYTSIGLSNGRFQIGYLGSDGAEYSYQVPMSALRGDNTGGYQQLPGNVLAPRLWNESSAPQISAGMGLIASIYEKQGDGAIAAMRGFELVVNYASLLQTAGSLFGGGSIPRAAPAPETPPSAALWKAPTSVRPITRSLGAGGEDMAVKKAVNSGLHHAVERGVERGVFANASEGASALRNLSEKISKSGLPKGTLVDTAHADRVLVPVGENGLAVYQVLKNGTARLKTVLIAR